MKDYIIQKVSELYDKDDANSARLMLSCLGDLFKMEFAQQTLYAAIGLHGTGGIQPLSGLVEGAQMFIGIYYSELGKSKRHIIMACDKFAQEFAQQIFYKRADDMENIYDSVHFAYEFIRRDQEEQEVYDARQYRR